jgi:serine/threonine protein kinase
VLRCFCCVRSNAGTPYFMAPEQMLQENVGRKSDMWALGGVALLMATGLPPWAVCHVANPYALFLKVYESKAPPPMEKSGWKNCISPAPNPSRILESRTQVVENMMIHLVTLLSNVAAERVCVFPSRPTHALTTWPHVLFIRASWPPQRHRPTRPDRTRTA